MAELNPDYLPNPETEKAEPRVRTTENVNEALADMEAAEDQLGLLLNKYGWDADDELKTKMLLAFREALTNAIFHGNYGVGKVTSGDDISKLAQEKVNAEGAANLPVEVKVSFQVNNKVVEIIIQDFGQGFDVNNVADPILQENILKTSGRGIHWMREFYDSVVFSGPRNQIVTLKKTR